MELPGSYLRATRHPWACLLFLLPLLATYEGGVLWLGRDHPEALRNGADTWLRWALESFGLTQLYWAPLLVGGAFLLWGMARRWDRPRDLFGVETGMVLESVAFAVGLWGISRGLHPLLERLGIPLQVPPRGEDAAVHVITFVGAGIYEEVMFRLVLYSGLRMLLTWVQTPGLLAIAVAAAASAALFSAAHNLGPYGEAFNGYVFLFRALAGLYFALLYQLRGFGIAVGAHACYDVIVGVIVP